MEYVFLILPSNVLMHDDLEYCLFMEFLTIYFWSTSTFSLSMLFPNMKSFAKVSKVLKVFTKADLKRNLFERGRL